VNAYEEGVIRVAGSLWESDNDGRSTISLSCCIIRENLIQEKSPGQKTSNAPTSRHNHASEAHSAALARWVEEHPEPPQGT
jgi:hypothetical protein